MEPGSVNGAGGSQRVRRESMSARVDNEAKDESADAALLLEQLKALLTQPPHRYLALAPPIASSILSLPPAQLPLLFAEPLSLAQDLHRALETALTQPSPSPPAAAAAIAAVVVNLMGGFCAQASDPLPSEAERPPTNLTGNIGLSDPLAVFRSELVKLLVLVDGAKLMRRMVQVLMMGKLSTRRLAPTFRPNLPPGCVPFNPLSPVTNPPSAFWTPRAMGTCLLWALCRACILSEDNTEEILQPVLRAVGQEVAECLCAVAEQFVWGLPWELLTLVTHLPSGLLWDCVLDRNLTKVNFGTDQSKCASPDMAPHPLLSIQGAVIGAVKRWEQVAASLEPSTQVEGILSWVPSLGRFLRCLMHVSSEAQLQQLVSDAFAAALAKMCDALLRCHPDCPSSLLSGSSGTAEQPSTQLVSPDTNIQTVPWDQEAWKDATSDLWLAYFDWQECNEAKKAVLRHLRPVEWLDCIQLLPRCVAMELALAVAASVHAVKDYVPPDQPSNRLSKKEKRKQSHVHVAVKEASKLECLITDERHEAIAWMLCDSKSHILEMCIFSIVPAILDAMTSQSPSHSLHVTPAIVRGLIDFAARGGTSRSDLLAIQLLCKLNYDGWFHNKEELRVQLLCVCVKAMKELAPQLPTRPSAPVNSHIDYIVCNATRIACDPLIKRSNPGRLSLPLIALEKQAALLLEGGFFAVLCRIIATVRAGEARLNAVLYTHRLLTDREERGVPDSSRLAGVRASLVRMVTGSWKVVEGMLELGADRGLGLYWKSSIMKWTVWMLGGGAYGEVAKLEGKALVRLLGHERWWREVGRVVVEGREEVGGAHAIRLQSNTAYWKTTRGGNMGGMGGLEEVHVGWGEVLQCAGKLLSLVLQLMQPLMGGEGEARGLEGGAREGELEGVLERLREILEDAFLAMPGGYWEPDGLVLETMTGERGVVKGGKLVWEHGGRGARPSSRGGKGVEGGKKGKKSSRQSGTALGQEGMASGQGGSSAGRDSSGRQVDRVEGKVGLAQQEGERSKGEGEGLGGGAGRGQAGVESGAGGVGQGPSGKDVKQITGRRRRRKKGERRSLEQQVLNSCQGEVAAQPEGGAQGSGSDIVGDRDQACKVGGSQGKGALVVKEGERGIEGREREGSGDESDGEKGSNVESTGEVLVGREGEGGRALSERKAAGVMKMCVGCGQVGDAMLLCGGCHEVRYCSQACQRKHWKVHRKRCKEVQAGWQGQRKGEGLL